MTRHWSDAPSANLNLIKHSRTLSKQERRALRPAVLLSEASDHGRIVIEKPGALS